MDEVYVRGLAQFRNARVTHASERSKYAQSGRRHGVAPRAGPLRRVLRAALLRVLDRPRFADDRHLDLPRILEMLLDLAGDLVREQRGLVVSDLLGLHDHANLTAGLQRVDALDAVL